MRQKARILLQAEEVIGRYTRVEKHRRRVGGTFGTIRDLFWRGDEPWCVLRLPTGRRVAVAASWTDLASEVWLVKKSSPQLSPARLVELAYHVREMKTLRRRRRASSKPKSSKK